MPEIAASGCRFPPRRLGTLSERRDALRRDRYRLQHHPRARRRAGGRAVEEGDGAARLHADQQGARRRRRDPARRRSHEVGEVVATQVRLAEELGAETIRAVATAAVREARNGDEVAHAIAEAAGVEVEVLSERGGGAALLHRRDQDARPPGRGQDRRRRRRRRLDRGDPRHASPAGSRRCAPGRSAPASSPTS